MKKQTVQFATVTKNGVVQKVGRGVMFVPKTNYKGGEMKYFDDSKLLKKNCKQSAE